MSGGINTRLDPLPTSLIVTATPSDAPAGGTGATAGAYDTADHRNAAIATINALVDCVDELKAEIASLRSWLSK